jgi:hypothetical protein
LEATVSEDALMRASDAEREQTGEALREHYAAGRLSTEEFDQRLDAAYKASTVQALAQLGSFWPVWVLIFPLVFVLRNIWRPHGPAPELERVQRKPQRHGRRHGGYPRHLP